MPTLSVSRLRWYAARVSAMPPQEWLHRTRSAALAARERAGGAPLPPAPPGEAGWPRPAGAPALVRDEDLALVAALPGALEAARRVAEPIAAGRVAILGHDEVEVGAEPDWSLDPVTGTRWPGGHWSTIDYRASAADPKWIWELGRHQHVVHLARAWRLTGDDRFADVAVRQLRSFLEQCPPASGIHWRVGLEVGMRLTSWAFAVEFLRGAPGTSGELMGMLRRSVAAHLAYLERYPSLHSSANNHRIGELAGAAVGALAFPELTGAEAVAGRALRSLEHELDRQVLPDGVGAEQAVAYAGFVLDLCVPVVVCLRRSGRPVPDGLARPLAGLADFLGTLASDGLTLPRIGDDDDAVGIDLAAGMDRPERLASRLRTAERLVGARARRPGGLDEQTAWLCGGGEPAGDGALPGGAVLPAGGYAVLRHRGDAAGEVRAVLKAGPFGLGPLYAHGHADLLSLCVSVAGEEAVVDPGTFSYYGDAGWRAYARSTAAHSTLRVDGREQAEPTGPFLWHGPPRAHLGRVTLDGPVLAAEAHHDAYAPVRHARRVEMRDGVIEVTDRLAGPAGEHALELRWHLAPGRVTAEGGGWRWRGEAAELHVTVEGLGPAELVEGREEPPLGWVSPGLERRRPAPALVARALVPLPATVVTRLRPGRAA